MKDSPRLVIGVTGQCNHREKGRARRSDNAWFSSCVFHSLLTDLTIQSVPRDPVYLKLCCLVGREKFEEE